MSQGHSGSDQKSDGYSPSLKWLHWLVFCLVCVSIVSIETQDFFPKGSTGRLMLRSSHYLAGLLVLLMMTARFFIRVSTEAPNPVAGAPWIQTGAHLAHIGLYGLMLAMPLVGLGSVLFSGKPLIIYDFSMISPFEPDLTLSRALKEIHETGSTFAYIAIGLHAAATLWHQFVLKDNILKRMT